MNITQRVIIVIVLASVMISPSIGKGDFIQTDQTTYIFDVNESKSHPEWGTNSIDVEGYSFEGTSIPVGTQFTISADFEQSREFTMTVGETSRTSICSFPTIMGEICSILFIPYSVTRHPEWMLSNLDQYFGVFGPRILDHFYLDSDTANFLNDLVTSDFISTFRYSDEWTFTQNNGTFVNNTDIATFRWIENGCYYNTTTNTDFSGRLEYLLAYNQTTGILQGYRIDIDYSGQVEGIDIKYIYLQEVEISGYDLPQYGNSNLISGFRWVIFGTVVTFIATTAFIKKRRS